MNVYNLTTDKLVNPLGIDSKKPMFSWKIDANDYMQKRYRISVASSLDLLNSSPDMWDSGTIQSNNSIDITYEGKKLESCKEYFWRVSVDGVDSDVARFETAFLYPENEFKAQWVGQPLGFSGAVDDVRLDFVVCFFSYAFDVHNLFCT